MHIVKSQTIPKVTRESNNKRKIHCQPHGQKYPSFSSGEAGPVQTTDRLAAGLHRWTGRGKERKDLRWF